MPELLQLLDGSIDDLKTGLAGKSHDDLLKLKQAETDGKSRRGALDAIEAALGDADRARTGGFTQAATSGVPAIAADLDPTGPADIAPATDIDTSGAPQQIVPDVDLSHPAVDNDPRAGTTERQNRIDFNDPTLSGSEAVERMLGGNGAA